MIQQLFYRSIPVFLQAGDNDVDVFPEGILQTVVGDIACHEAETLALGLYQCVILAQVNVRAGVHNHLVEGGV